MKNKTKSENSAELMAHYQIHCAHVVNHRRQGKLLASTEAILKRCAARLGVKLIRTRKKRGAAK